MFLSLCIGTGHAALLRGDRAALRRRPRAARGARQGRARDARGVGAPARALRAAQRRCSGSTSTTSTATACARWARSRNDRGRPSCCPTRGRCCWCAACCRTRPSARCARSTVADSELFRAADGRVPAYVGLEYMAQCIAAHGGLVARALGRAPSPGLLVGAKQLALAPRVAARPDESLEVSARLLGPRGRARLVRLRAARGRRARRRRARSRSTCRTRSRERRCGRSARRVLVTGASRGIGRACALGLAARGLRPRRRLSRGRDAAAESVAKEMRALGPRRAAARLRRRRPRRRPPRALERDVAEAGAYWGVVLAAGVHADAAFPALTGDAWDRVLRTNLDGFYNVLRPLVMPLVRMHDGGRIVAISSVAGLVGEPRPGQLQRLEGGAARGDQGARARARAAARSP